MALPPVMAGVVKATEACALPEVAAPIVGAPGTTGMMKPPDELNGEPKPEIVAPAVFVLRSMTRTLPPASPTTAYTSELSGVTERPNTGPARGTDVVTV